MTSICHAPLDTVHPTILAMAHQTGSMYHQWEDIVRLARHYIYMSSDSDTITGRVAFALGSSRVPGVSRGKSEQVMIILKSRITSKNVQNQQIIQTTTIAICS